VYSKILVHVYGFGMNMELDLTLRQQQILKTPENGVLTIIFEFKKKIDWRKCKWGATKFLPYIKPYSGDNTKVDACHSTQWRE